MNKRFFTIWVFLLAHSLFLNQAQASDLAHSCADFIPEVMLTQDAGSDTFKIELFSCTGKDVGPPDNFNFFWRSWLGDPSSGPPDDIGVDVDIDGTNLEGNIEGQGAAHKVEDGVVTIKNTNDQEVSVWVNIYTSDTSYVASMATYKVTMAAAGTGSDDGGSGSAATPVPALPLFALLGLGGLLGFLGLRKLRQ